MRFSQLAPQHRYSYRLAGVLLVLLPLLPEPPFCDFPLALIFIMAAKEMEKNIMKQTFDRFDADSDGHLQMLEVKELFKSMKWDVSDDNMQKAMAFLDKDHNGTLEFEEFLKFKEYAFQSHVLHEPTLTPKHRNRGALSRLREEEGVGK